MSCRIGFLSGSVSARRSDAISFKTSCSTEPNNGEQRYPECSRTKSPPPLIKEPEYSQHDLTALTERKWQQEEGRSWGGGGAGVVDDTRTTQRSSSDGEPFSRVAASI